MMAVYALFAVYAERKVSAWIQNRLGPMVTGPKGLFQTLADILKLLTKEEIVPTEANRFLFRLSPLIIFASVFGGFAVLPFFPGFGASMNIGIMYIFGVLSLEVVGIFLAGWSSNNKFSMLGGIRSVSQVIAYEIPAGLALLAAIMVYGTMDLSQISFQQGLQNQEVYFLGMWEVSKVGGFFTWGVFLYPHLLLAWFVYFIASLAESNRAPFDLPEAESELISGFHTEYSGFRFALIMLAEYGIMLLTGMVAAVVFWGGWNSPLPNFHLGENHILLSQWTTGSPGSFSAVLWGTFWVLTKAFAAIGIHMILRWTLPRFRVDQVTKMGWKVLTPVALLLVLISGIWKVLEAQP